MPITPKGAVKLAGKPDVKLRSNGSIMADDGDNTVWYVGADRNEYEFHAKTGEWFLLGKY